MRLLIKKRVKDQSELREETFLGRVLRLGSATDQDLQVDDISVPLSCCEFTVEAGRLNLKVLERARVFVNNKLSRGAVLKPGDVIHIGICWVEVVESVENYDAVLLFFTDRRNQKTIEIQQRLEPKFDGMGFSKRKLAWSLVVLILGVCVLLPGLVAFDPELREPIRTSSVLPDDSIWDSGPLHRAHRMIGDDCSACHEVAFSRVQDTTCLNCHAQINEHASAEAFPEAGLDGVRCATCHVEHHVPSVLVQRDSGGCVSCHQGVDAFKGGVSDLQSVANFPDDHPEFKVSLPMMDTQRNRWPIKRVSLSDPDLKSSSNLKFPHDLHLDSGGIEGAAGRVVMNCGDCHQPDPGGATMAPVGMEKDCSSCHLLTFDSGYPQRQLPHGAPGLLLPVLEEFYAKRTLVGEDLAAGRPLFPAERPGREPRMEAALRAQALVLAKRQALATAEDIFERTTCAICHQVDRKEVEGGELTWEVLPVKLVDRWMPKSVFDHQPHKDQSCATCHNAKASAFANDVLMPDLANCKTCHGGPESDNKIQSECIDCHQFHHPQQGLMGADLDQFTLSLGP